MNIINKVSWLVINLLLFMAVPPIMMIVFVEDRTDFRGTEHTHLLVVMATAVYWIFVISYICGEL